MNYKDFERFAEKHNIKTIEVDGTMGCGYLCTYIYFEPESVIRAIEKIKSEGIKHKKEDT